jgi:conjugative transfer region protein TrbK
MAPSARIAGAAALAGLMMTVAIVAAVSEPRASAVAVVASTRPERDPLAAELARCRVLTMPDSGCEAAWTEHRRRFLGNEGAPR